MRGLLYIFSQHSEMWVRQTGRTGQTTCPDCPHRSDLEWAVNAPQQQLSICICWPVSDWSRVCTLLVSPRSQVWAIKVFCMDNGNAIQHRLSSWKHYLVIKKPESEKLLTFTLHVDSGFGSNLFNARTKHLQKHFSVCSLQLEKETKLTKHC